MALVSPRLAAAVLVVGLVTGIGATEAGDRVAAKVVSVETTGSAGEYEFAVGISSPDTGCEQYASWWEVVSLEGDLLYRRILTHSHPTEQPFVRHGGPVAIAAEREVWVRAYMHPTGYGGAAFKGSVETGFRAAEPPTGFAAGLALSEPLPTGCTS